MGIQIKLPPPIFTLQCYITSKALFHHLLSNDTKGDLSSIPLLQYIPQLLTFIYMGMVSVLFLTTTNYRNIKLVSYLSLYYNRCIPQFSTFTHPFLLALAQSNTLWMAVTPSLPRGTMSPPVITA